MEYRGIWGYAMTLRRRTALAVLAACAAFALIVLVTVQGNLAATAADLEKQQAVHSLQLASNTLYQDVNTLNATVGVWAQRDDSYQFMQDGNAEYVTSNLNSAALLNLDVDFVIFVDPDGQVFYSKAVASPGGEETSLPSGLTQFVTGDGVLARHNSETGSTSGLLFLQDDLVVAASQPIVTSQGQGPMAGALIMGRYLDESEVQRMSMLTGLTLEIHRVDDADIPDDFQVARSTLTQIDNTLIRALDGQTMASYMLVSEMNGSPAFILRVSEPRDAYARAEASGRRALGLLICISVAFALILVLGIDVLVVSRLRRFRKGVEAVAQGQSLSERVAIGGRDELAAAAEVVNRTLDSLERSQRELAESQARNRSLVEAIPELMFRISQDGTILEIRKPQKVASPKDNHDGVEGHNPKDEIFDIIPTEIQHIVMPHVATALESGQTQIFEFQMSVDGNMSYYEGRVLANGYGEALVIVRDITDQRRTEESRQNVQLLREIHDRVKNHLKLMRSFPDARLRQAFNPTPEPRLATESQPQDTAAHGGGQPQKMELPAEGQPHDPVVPDNGQPQNMELPAEGQPQNAVATAESQPNHAETADAVPSAKGN